MKDFELSLPSKKQVIDTLKVAAYLGVSTILDYLIHETTGTQFGSLTVVINLVLVTIKKFITKG